jgi:hypothetical protein
MTMADDTESNQKKPKTKELCDIQIVKLEKASEWKAYKATAAKFSEAKDASIEAKEAMRQFLRQKLPDILKNKDFDFKEKGKTEITIFEILEPKAGRTGTPDLSDRF